MSNALQKIHEAVMPLVRGYRSNKWLDMVRPAVHLKQKYFLAMEELEIMYGGAAYLPL